MLLTELKLQEFKEGFNQVLRKEEPDQKEKFKTVKKELIKHLKQFEKDLNVFPGLRIYTILDKNIVIEYIETTGSNMKINLIWKIQELDYGKTLDKVDEVCEKLKVPIPTITISDNSMGNVLAVYYPNNQEIIINKNTLMSYNDEEIESIIKHEIIHHKLSLEGKDASDTSEDFINTVIQEKAFVSKDTDAQKAFKKVTVDKNKK